MAAYYYLISQLPSLDGYSDTAPLPIDEARFMELVRGQLGKNTQNDMEKLTLTPPMDSEKTSSPLLSAWYDGERDLRLALGKIRAEKMNKTFTFPNKILSAALIKTATDAQEADNPFEAEKILFSHRLSFLESLRPTDTFCEDFLFYYGLKLKLLVRMRQFDPVRGEAAYRKIYNSILQGDKKEVNP